MSAGPTGLRLLVEGIARVQADVMTRDGALLKALIQPKPEPAVRTVEVEAHVRHVQELVERALSVATGLSPAASASSSAALAASTAPSRRWACATPTSTQTDAER